MKNLDLAFYEVSVNDGGLTVEVVLLVSDGACVVPPPDNVYGLVPVFSLVLERYPTMYISLDR